MSVSVSCVLRDCLKARHILTKAHREWNRYTQLYFLWSAAFLLLFINFRYSGLHSKLRDTKMGLLLANSATKYTCYVNKYATFKYIHTYISQINCLWEMPIMTLRFLKTVQSIEVLPYTLKLLFQ